MKYTVTANERTAAAYLAAEYGIERGAELLATLPRSAWFNHVILSAAPLFGDKTKRDRNGQRYITTARDARGWANRVHVLAAAQLASADCLAVRVQPRRVCEHAYA